MGPIKKHWNMSNHQEMKHRDKSNISELVYKFLIANEAFDGAENCLINKCHCDREKHHEITDPNISKSTDYKTRKGRRKDSDKIAKLYNVKQCPISKNLPISYLQKCMNGEDTKKAKKYMKEALDFGVESGYLIPSDSTHTILHVSSDLMKNDLRRNKINIYDMNLSKNRDTPNKMENFQESKRRQRKRGRHRRSQRSRSASRTRHRSKRRRKNRSHSKKRRRYSSPQNSEEVAEDKTDDYEMNENDPKNNKNMDNTKRKSKIARSNQFDEEQSTKKIEEDGSDLSIDENETVDEYDRKSIHTIR